MDGTTVWSLITGIERRYISPTPFLPCRRPGVVFEPMNNLTIESLVRRVDVFTLKLFMTAIEEGQIGRAAFREHVVPSAATRRFQDLEDLIGMKLFDRSSRGMNRLRRDPRRPTRLPRSDRSRSSCGAAAPA